MKEIKAYIRVRKAEEVIHALEDAGVPGFTAIEVKAIGRAVEPERVKYSVEYAERVSPITKLEVVCKDEDVKRLVDIIREKAYTGHKGDGIIFVSDITDAVKIRTGEEGERALLPGSEK
ncbi:MAG: P-II family nitrogen regulator [Deltaproteobacteria bacterium]|nr:P-II family nitrogen regulator [Deltaproteobacteria bacterium]